jgi:hypothetical protein
MGGVMRERRPGDWRVDLARRHPLEDLVEAALDAHPALVRLASHTTSLDRLDYSVLGPGERLCQLELKAKHQPYRSWATLRPDTVERDLFILDELALRKLIAAGPYAALLVRDDPADRWVLWTTMDLVLADKVRINRRLATGLDRLKAKVLVDLSDSPHHHHTLPKALSAFAVAMRMIDRHWAAIGPWPTNRPIRTVGAAS